MSAKARLHADFRLFPPRLAIVDAAGDVTAMIANTTGKNDPPSFAANAAKVPGDAYRRNSDEEGIGK